MSSEYDPLLPRDKPAPEISGHGFSKSSSERYQEQDEEEVNETSRVELQTASSLLKTVIGFFTVVVSLSLLIALLVPGGLGSSWKKNVKNNTSSIKVRVDSIMSQNPLIGCYSSLFHYSPLSI